MIFQYTCVLFDMYFNNNILYFYPSSYKLIMDTEIILHQPINFNINALCNLIKIIFHQFIFECSFFGILKWFLMLEQFIFWSSFRRNPLPTTCHQLPVTNHLSAAICHQPPVTCYLSPTTRHLPLAEKCLPTGLVTLKLVSFEPLFGFLTQCSLNLNCIPSFWPLPLWYPSLGKKCQLLIAWT